MIKYVPSARTVSSTAIFVLSEAVVVPAFLVREPSCVELVTVCVMVSAATLFFSDTISAVFVVSFDVFDEMFVVFAEIFVIFVVMSLLFVCMLVTFDPMFVPLAS